jgi:hypothetical protein
MKIRLTNPKNTHRTIALSGYPAQKKRLMGAVGWGYK